MYILSTLYHLLLHFLHACYNILLPFCSLSYFSFSFHFQTKSFLLAPRKSRRRKPSCHLIILIITNQVNLMLASSFCLSVSLFVHLFIYPFKHASSLLSLPHCLYLPISRPISIFFLYLHFYFFLYMRMINFDDNER